jgi:hypothetical protein
LIKSGLVVEYLVAGVGVGKVDPYILTILNEARGEHRHGHLAWGVVSHVADINMFTEKQDGLPV